LKTSRQTVGRGELAYVVVLVWYLTDELERYKVPIRYCTEGKRNAVIIVDSIRYSVVHTPIGFVMSFISNWVQSHYLISILFRL